ncbi:hypothetical protein [Sinorhizobium fredii]|uniref:Uncharacterized protein n=1 Tax=Rhizobium fredii TaxID=380 RepID=A0A844A6B0_RHIFR|nr:hypothetical protein [Sinorhizobium fredii]MQX08659.1 hypothetical protein [Sinorhizobium fredii]GEC30526.1 hypothetical protein EFR01_06970 [Sinorhizobium fredii]GLS09723.1 hypothetical protein GCM10007864_33540 [Sinorhizobium fredii]
MSERQAQGKGSGPGRRLHLGKARETGCFDMMGFGKKREKVKMSFRILTKEAQAGNEQSSIPDDIPSSSALLYLRNELVALAEE